MASRLVQVHVAGAQRELQQRGGLGPDAAPPDVDPALVPLEANALGLLAVVAEDHAKPALGGNLNAPRDGRVGQAGGGEDGGALDLDPAGAKLRGAPQGAIHVVNAPGADPADAVVVDEVPVEAAHQIVVGRLRRGAQPHLVVQPRRRIGRLGHGQAAPARHAHLDRVQLSEVSVHGQLGGEAEVAAAALLGAELEHAPVAADRLAHGLALAGGERHGLLAVDVLAVAHGPDRVQGMPELGRGDEHRVDVVAGDQVAEVGVRVAALVGAPADFVGVALLGPLAVRLALRLERVAGGHDLDGRVTQHRAEVAAPLAADADVARADAVVCRRAPAGTQDGSGHESRKRDGPRGPGEEPASRHRPRRGAAVAAQRRVGVAHVRVSLGCEVSAPRISQGGPACNRLTPPARCARSGSRPARGCPCRSRRR